MTHVRLTSDEQRQVDELDRLCDEINLARGQFARGGKHGRYTVQLPNGTSIFVVISCTPRCVEQAISIARKNFRKNIAKRMGWAR